MSAENQPRLQELTLEELRTLVARAYPMGRSGMCSWHGGPRKDWVVDCRICFPNPWELVSEHNRLKQAAWERLRELGENPPR